MEKTENINEKKCNHDYKDNNNTLKKMSKVEMVYPPVNTYFCEVCRKYIKIPK